LWVVITGAPGEAAATTLDQALAELGYAGKVVATAVNGDFIPARKRETVTLAEGDRIEVVAPMQGG
jgi:sulfur carrier protein